MSSTMDAYHFFQFLLDVSTLLLVVALAALLQYAASDIRRMWREARRDRVDDGE